MNITVTVTANATTTLQDTLGLQAYAKGATWVSTSTAFGLVTSFTIPEDVWDRVRPMLNAMSAKRIPAMDTAGVALGTGVTMPLLTYTAEWVPGGRPRVYQMEGVPLSAGTPLIMTFRGTNLVAGVSATSLIETFSAAGTYALPGTRSFAKGRNVLRFDAVAKGPVGNMISYSIQPASGAGSVTPTFTADGGLYVKIVPAAGASDSTSIAAQVAANAVASLFLVGTALVASAPIPPTPTGITTTTSGPGGLTASNAGSSDRVFLTGGDGGGIAVLDTFVAAGIGTNRLRLTANKPGNDSNLITLTINVSQVGNTVVTTGNNIVVNRTAATTTIAALVTAINANAGAAALITASAVGSGSLGALTKTWLYGGAGEPVTCTVAGAPGALSAFSDTAFSVLVLAADLTTAGATATEGAVVQLKTNWGLVSIDIGVLAT